MKKRIITAIVAIAVIVVPCFAFMHTIIFPIILALFSSIAVYEIIKATGGKNHLLMSLSCISAAAIPFLVHFNIEIPLMPVAIIYVLVYFIIMVLMYSKTAFSDVITALFSTVAIPTSLSVFIRLRDCYVTEPELYTKTNGVYFILFAMLCAWGTDSFALFAGKLFGKHKLCPNISPNKTVEGAVGGIIGTVILNIIVFLIFDKFLFTVHTILWWQIIIISAVLSVISMFGDLSASIIKRNHNIKDFGNLFPGHGGVMDRIDSCVFVLAALYMILYFINI